MNDEDAPPSDLAPSVQIESGPVVNPVQQTAGVKRKRPAADGPEAEHNKLRVALTACVKDADFARACELYEQSVMAGVAPSSHVYSLLLNIASRATHVPPPVVRDALKVFSDMKARNLTLNEAAYSSVIRICAIGGDVERAQALLHEMKAGGVSPRLRTYSPVIIALSQGGRAAEAHALVQEVAANNLPLTQVEHAALLRAHALAGDEGGALSSLLRMADETPLVADHLAVEVQEYFSGQMEALRRKGNLVASAAVQPKSIASLTAGGSAHSPVQRAPQGWPWRVALCSVDQDTSVCSVTGQTLRSIDLDSTERGQVMQQCYDLLCTSGQRVIFRDFQDFVASTGPFDVIIDGANVGYVNQNFKDGALSYSQIDAVARAFQARGYKVLIIIHSRWLQTRALSNEDARRAGKRRVNYYAARQRGELDEQSGLLKVKVKPRVERGEGGTVEERAEPPPAPAVSKHQVWRASVARVGAAPQAAGSAPPLLDAALDAEDDADASSLDSYDSAEERGDFGSEPEAGAHSSAAGIRALGGDPHIAETSTEDTRMAPDIIARWNAEGIFYSVPVSFNDDWFWLYAGIASQAAKDAAVEPRVVKPSGSGAAPPHVHASGRSSAHGKPYDPLESLPSAVAALPPSRQPVWLVSNDLMRDHHFQMLHNRALVTWRDRHQVHVQVPAWKDGSTGLFLRRLHFSFPVPYSHVVQWTPDGRVWHFPLTAPVVAGPGVTTDMAAKAHNTWLVAEREGDAPIKMPAVGASAGYSSISSGVPPTSRGASSSATPSAAETPVGGALGMERDVGGGNKKRRLSGGGGAVEVERSMH